MGPGARRQREAHSLFEVARSEEPGVGCQEGERRHRLGGGLKIPARGRWIGERLYYEVLDRLGDGLVKAALRGTGSVGEMDW